LDAAQPRAYRSELRARQAGETRQRIVAAAAELFGELGYTATTLRKIAARAGVSPETVQAHGPKAALARAAFEMVAIGAEGVDDVTEVELGRSLMAAGRAELPAAVGRLLVMIQSPAARVMRAVVGGAAVDTELAEYYGVIVASMRQQWSDAYDEWTARGWTRIDRSKREIVDAWCVVASPEGYLRLVGDYGWTDDQYAAWIATRFEEDVLAPDDRGSTS
jgi:AcrR family transcriptional regulator